MGSTASAHLAQRAEAYLRGRGGVAPEDALIVHVFGSAGGPTLWRPLLRSLLAGCERLTLRADGCWAIVEERPTPVVALLDEFVVVDVETTGLRPARQRIVEVAAVRWYGGREVARVESVLNPGRSLPKYVADLTGLTDADLESAPTFASVAPALVELIGSSLIVGHNVEFDLAFLNAELVRAGLPTLVNDRLDTMGLAARLVPQLRKPSLDAIAERLGVSGRPRNLHRAGPDATMTAAVALKLAEQARDAGYATLDEVRAIGRSLPAPPKERHERGRALLDRSLLSGVPKAPGVYLMKNQFGQIVYVGKAKNLRDRVGSYFSQPLGYTRKMDGLLESLAAIETIVVGSELEALLLESQLIRRYQPRYNTALRSHEQYPFIRVDVANPWPRITLAKARKDDGARYFGPFRNAASARRTVELLNRVVPLRTCSRSFRDARSYGSPCIELDLGRCLGPCVGRADRDRYRGLVTQVVSFLDGRDDSLFELLWSGLEEAAAKLDFEKAERLRRELRHVDAVVGTQRRLRETIELGNCILVLPTAEVGARDVWLVVGGRIWARCRAVAGTTSAWLAERLRASWSRLHRCGLPTVDHDSVDEAQILYRWLARQEHSPAVLRLGDEPAWDDVAARVMAVPRAALPAEFGRLDELGEEGNGEAVLLEPAGGSAVEAGGPEEEAGPD